MFRNDDDQFVLALLYDNHDDNDDNEDDDGARERGKTSAHLQLVGVLRDLRTARTKGLWPVLLRLVLSSTS